MASTGRVSRSKTTISFPSTIFSIAVYPEKPVVASGLSTGHVFIHRYAADEGVDASKQDGDGSSGEESDRRIGGKMTGGEFMVVDRLWKTRRHKGSCRGVAFDEQGSYLYSVGTDSVIKQASPETGKVIAKNSYDIESSSPSALTTTATHALVGTEEATLHVFDPRTMKPVNTFTDLHDDYITSISHLAQYQNTYHLITTGSTTVTRIDIRKGKLSTSEDQEDEILCSCISYPPDFEYNPIEGRASDGAVPEKRPPVTAVMGMATGVLTFWTKDNWEDQQTRAVISNESIDCVAEYPDQRIIAGGADGLVRLVDVRRRKAIKEFEHGGEDGVVSVATDAWGRVISAGGEVVRVWSVEDECDEDKAGSESDDSDAESGSRGSDDDSSDDSDENGKKKKRKKTKRRKRARAKNRLAAMPKTPVKANFSGLD
ncbi:WD40-repeat-containing domain protein [Lipomyces tetrasporus]|uniref:WD repeat-containing protein JIP5 n=1 Tax=Lipomyces tetrasporus TaxID=54092 RepID=A0AAD7QY78_9ASCO|nr:WD40-repeat-containing domain protein [Lipomyces tetrasporus]KAJ8103191.1 WD40-repeat-containing domain protein [Lipomyces tetrasporus]